MMQLQKCLLQSTLDNGQWDSAMLLWPYPDVMSPEEFGGSEVEMQRVHAYRKALSELRVKSRPTQQEGEDEEEPRGPKGGAREKKEGKGDKGEGK